MIGLSGRRSRCCVANVGYGGEKNVNGDFDEGKVGLQTKSDNLSMLLNTPKSINKIRDHYSTYHKNQISACSLQLIENTAMSSDPFEADTPSLHLHNPGMDH